MTNLFESKDIKFTMVLLESLTNTKIPQLMELQLVLKQWNLIIFFYLCSQHADMTVITEYIENPAISNRVNGQERRIPYNMVTK